MIEGQFWFVKTKRLIIASTQKSLIESSINSINNPSLDSLADNVNFVSARKEHDGAAVFAYADPKTIIDQLPKQIRRETAIARMVLDASHLKHITASLSSTDNGVRLKTQVAMDDNHNSLAYGLIKTVPLSQKALKNVPAGSAVVVGMGLNPKLILAADAVQDKRITGLDIGRELFANIEEIALFVLPSVSAQNDEVPNIGLVVSSNDTNKSEKLWNQLLSLPAMANIQEGPSASDVDVAGVKARQYVFPGDDVPTILIARLSEDSLIAGTHAAVKHAIESNRSGNLLASDSSATPLMNRVSSETAKAAFVHIGRCLNLASKMARGNEARQMQMVSHVIEDLNLTLTIEEAPADLNVEINATGLPQFENIVRTLAKMNTSQNTRSAKRVDLRLRVNAAEHTQSSPSDAKATVAPADPS